MPITTGLGMVTGELQKLTQVAKNSERETICGFKVIKFGINRMGICDFLLMTNSKYGYILHTLQVMVIYRSKIAFWTQCLI